MLGSCRHSFSKALTAVMAGCLITSATLAQVAGGGVGGGGAGSSGNWVVVEIAGNWELSTRATISGQLVQVSPSGKTDTATQNPIASASIWGVAGTATAKSSMKREFKVRWIGTGTPEKYAYVKLLSTVNYWNTPNTGASVVVGLPPIQPTGDPEELPWIVAAGRKIAKVEVGTDGTAIFNVDNSIVVTATAPVGPGSAGNNGQLDSSGTLFLKALGLSFGPTTKRMEDVTPTGSNVYPWPAEGDDFEHQFAEIAVTPLIQHISVDVNPNVPPDVDPDPVEYDTLVGGSYSVASTLELRGQWITAPTPAFSSGASSVSDGQREDILSSFPNYPDWHGVRAWSEGLSSMEVEQMRSSSKDVTVFAHGTDTSPLTSHPGPFAGDLTIKLWAPERILYKIENSGRLTVDYPPLTCGTNWFHQLKNVNATQTVNVATSTSMEFSGEVNLTAGGNFSPFSAVGVKIDTGFKLGKKWTRSVISSAGLSWAPNQTTECWTRFKATRNHTDMTRILALYGPGGYIADAGSTVVDSKKPLSVGEWEFRYTAPGV